MDPSTCETRGTALMDEASITNRIERQLDGKAYAWIEHHVIVDESRNTLSGKHDSSSSPEASSGHPSRCWTPRINGVSAVGLESSYRSRLAFIFALVVSRSAVAGGPLGNNGDPIETSRYSIDFYQGPIYSGSRVVGLGGAYVAVAEDVDGNLQNAAAPAVRPYYSIDYFDYSLGLAIAYPPDIENLDFFNSGSPTAVRGSDDNFLFATPAMNLQWGTFGLGVTAEIQSYAFESSGNQAPGSVQPQLGMVVSTLHLQAANAFYDHQLVVGLGSRILVQAVEATTEEDARDLFSSQGSGLEVGVLYRPENLPFRLGFAAREAIETSPRFKKDLLPDDAGDITIPSGDAILYLPEQVSTPWDVNVGAAVQFGREFNPRWRHSEDEAERAILYYRSRELDREYERETRLLQAKDEAEREAIEAELDRAQERDDELLEKAIDNARQLIRLRNAESQRSYLLLSTSLLISGRAYEAVGVDAFLSQVVNRSGERAVYSPRLGAESEVWPNLVRLRAGTYLEPTRFETSSPRWHGTLGLDVRLLRWSVFGLWPDDYLWRLGVSADVSQRYAVGGLSIGGWYPRLAKSPF